MVIVTRFKYNRTVIFLFQMQKNLDFNDSAQHGLLTQLLRLAHNCLTFDFIGTSTDESSDDLCTVQIPTAWRPAFLEYSTLQLFFDLYFALPASLSPLALSCLVQIASVRRSLFNNAERGKFLNQLVAGVRKILQMPQELSLCEGDGAAPAGDLHAGGDPGLHHEPARVGGGGGAGWA